MHVELPTWLGAQRGTKRSRTFMIIKLILFVSLVVGIIEMLLTSPFYYQIIDHEARLKMTDQDPSVYVLLFSTFLSIGYGLVVSLVGLHGVLRERMITIIVYTLLALVGAIYTVARYHQHCVLIVAVISNCLVASLALFFAYMIHRSDTKPYNLSLI